MGSGYYGIKFQATIILNGCFNPFQATKSALKDVQSAIAKVEDEIGAILNRIISASNERVIEAYETKIDALEKDKLVLQEKLQNKPQSMRPFEDVFELCLKFLSNPSNLWENGKLEDQKTVLRLAFDKPLAWVRGRGFRAPKTSSVFNVLELISAPTKVVAETKGFEPSMSFWPILP